MFLFIIKSILIISIFSILFARIVKSDTQILPYPTVSCGGYKHPQFVCLIECPTDFRCQALGWNLTLGGECGCGVQYCPNGQIYSFSDDYTKSTPLTDYQISQQPFVKFPCFGCVPEEIAPFYEQIGDCSHLNRTSKKGC